jgi:hypothetical protein
MEKYKQKIITVNKFEANSIINYLQKDYAAASAGVFNLKENGQIKIQSYEDKIEFLCDCSKRVINELEEIIEQNE